MLSLIVAKAENDVIGREGELPWRLAADLRRFRELTWGHTVVIGRRTHESIGRPLPGRRTIVLSRAAGGSWPGVIIARSLAEAIEAAGRDDEVFVAGGAEVYRSALERIDRAYVTVVHGRFEGDARFPAGALALWRVVSEEHREADSRNSHPFTFRVLEPPPRNEEASS